MELNTPSRIRVEIGELVLDGFGPVDADRLSAAFRRELTRLVTEWEGEPLAVQGALDVLTGLPQLRPTASPDRLGVALARAVHAGLTGRGSSRHAPSCRGPGPRSAELPPAPGPEPSGGGGR
jgi:hypothetical protein